jgi:hypothetical protein
MKWKILNMKTFLTRISAIILLVGLGSAIAIYLTAENESNSVLGYEAADGDVYQLAPENSRMYARNLELFGGKAALLTNEFRLWFVGLWHGKSLAVTLACITIVVSLGVFFVANHLPSKVHGENNRRGKYFNP